MNNFGEKVNFIWNIANLLRGPYKPEKYGDIILPLSVLRRFNCILESIEFKVLEKSKEVEIPEFLNAAAELKFQNKSKYDFGKLFDDPDNIAENLRAYIRGFSCKNIW